MSVLLVSVSLYPLYSFKDPGMLRISAASCVVAQHSYFKIPKAQASNMYVLLFSICLAQNEHKVDEWLKI
jgi:hypothetical protein